MEANRDDRRLHENDEKYQSSRHADTDSSGHIHNGDHYDGHGRPNKAVSGIMTIYIWLSVLLLLINYFLAQFDKFILSYFQTPLSESLNLSASQYAVLSGYATGIVYALTSIPLSYIADVTTARVWTLSVAALWWSLCVIFQSLSKTFWQLLLARIGMGIGQSCVEPISISLISDLIGDASSGEEGKGWRNVFIGGGIFYVGVYIGEAISGQIAVVFVQQEEGWRVALRAIGITGLVVAVLVRLIVRERKRLPGLIVDDKVFEDRSTASGHWVIAKTRLSITIAYLLRMRSFWLLVLSAGIRQLAGNVFGYYMPSYLSNTFPDKTELLSRYGIIVGVVGTVAVLSGGAATSILWPRTKMTPLYLTGVGGMISSLFVLLMLFSLDIANGNQTSGIRILYGTMSAAYLTAELWLGAINGLIASILPPKHKTFGLAIWSTIQVLIYSSGPGIVGLALQGLNPGSAEYTKDTQLVLAVIIPVCYWIAGIGFLLAVPLLKADVRNGVEVEGRVSGKRKRWLSGVAAVVMGLVVALFVASIYYAAT